MSDCDCEWETGECQGPLGCKAAAEIERLQANYDAVCRKWCVADKEIAGLETFNDELIAELKSMRKVVLELLAENKRLRAELASSKDRDLQVSNELC